ncbi:MAG: carbon-nitrogen family hydrolase [Desulfobacteraceae bacterium]|nr:carbon-nitrogen family hydrolase [Desulfobacteraceae bacterium]
MRVASIQMGMVEGDKARTIDKAVENIRLARDADLILLPELWNIGFMSFDRYLPEAEDKNGPTLTKLRELAREVESYLHAGSFVEEEEGKYYNSSYLISPQGEILDNYRKLHLFGYNSRETQILNRGDEVVVAKTPLGNFGLATCYDLRFPELFRRMVERGAEVFLICSAWPYPRLEHWIMLNRVRALENQCFLVSANSTGQNMGTIFVGHSMVVDPWGVILSSGGDDEVILRSELDLKQVYDARERFPALADRLTWLNKMD